LLDNCTEDWEINVLRERLSKLKGGVAIVHVGAASDTEVKEKMDRIDDAICATRAALEEGILPGGGLAYYRVHFEEKFRSHIRSGGYKLVYDSIIQPMKCIAENSGVDFGLVLDEISITEGYNAK